MAGENTENTGTTETPGAGADDSAVDYAEILQQQQQALQQTGKTVEELRRQLGDSHETMTRVKDAFAGKQAPEVNPYQAKISQYEELQNYYAEEALKHQRAGGSGMPLTTKAGLELAKLGIESERRAESLQKELNDIKLRLDKQSNPNLQGLERAAHVMEGMVSDGLEQMYPGQDSRQIRAAQYDAITHRINAEIKDLMKNDPDTLLRIQRDPKHMRSMVNHFMAEILPPKVRTMLEDQRIQETPMDVRELYSAFGEAKEQLEAAMKKDDKKATHEASRWMDKIRQDILAVQYGGRKNNPDRPSLNQLMRTGR